MKRRLFNLAAALSLLVCVAMVGLWLRSYYVIEGLIWRFNHQSGIGVATGPGRVYMGYSTEPENATSPRVQYVNIPVKYPLSEASPVLFEFAGFGIYNSATMKSARIPFWFVLAAFTSIGVMCLRGTRAPRPGRCLTCGYDLRATPDRCPECGTIAEPSKSTL